MKDIHDEETIKIRQKDVFDIKRPFLGDLSAGLNSCLHWLSSTRSTCTLYCPILISNASDIVHKNTGQKPTRSLTFKDINYAVSYIAQTAKEKNCHSQLHRMV